MTFANMKEPKVILLHVCYVCVVGFFGYLVFGVWIWSGCGNFALLGISVAIDKPMQIRLEWRLLIGSFKCARYIMKSCTLIKTNS